MTEKFQDPNDDTNAYWFVAHLEEVERSECSADDAAKLLTYAAEYLENGEVVPEPLAKLIAVAFRRTASVEEQKRPAELAAWLNLTAPNRRPKIPTNDLGTWMFRQLVESPQKSETAALKEAAMQHGISKTTATVHWREWKKRNHKAVEILALVRKAPPSIRT